MSRAGALRLLVLGLIATSLGLLLILNRRGPVHLVDLRDGVMGTRVGIELYAPDEETGARALAAAWLRLGEIDALLSNWREDSLISRVNRDAAATPVPVDADTFLLLTRSREYWEISGGTFDPSIGPLQEIWKPLGHLAALPAEADVGAARALVGFDKVRLDAAARTVAFSAPGMAIDLGAIAKGWAADEAAHLAMARGALCCRVNAGGDLAAYGAPPGSPAGFEVTIRDPRGRPEDSLPAYTLHLLDGGAATSGNYERFTEVAGRRYSHILDPRTGWPVPDAVTQVTVLAPTGLDADALATALVVLGPVDGLRLAEARKDVEALFLLPEGDGFKAVATSGFPRPRGQP